MFKFKKTQKLSFKTMHQLYFGHGRKIQPFKYAFYAKSYKYDITHILRDGLDFKYSFRSLYYDINRNNVLLWNPYRVDAMYENQDEFEDVTWDMRAYSVDSPCIATRSLDEITNYYV